MGAVIGIAAWGIRPSYPWLIGSAICATAMYAAGSWFVVFNWREREQLLALVTKRGQNPTELAPIGAAVQ
jgi:hypothetical protein